MINIPRKMPAARVHSEGCYRWREQTVWSPWKSLMFNKIFLDSFMWASSGGLVKRIVNKILFQRSHEADHMSVISSWQLTTLVQSFKISSKGHDQQCNCKLQVDNDWLKFLTKKCFQGFALQRIQQNGQSLTTFQSI